MKIKTDHNGPKHGNGSYWGPKKWAKKISNKIRRRDGKKYVSEYAQTTKKETPKLYFVQTA